MCTCRWSPRFCVAKVQVLVELYRKRRELQSANEALARANAQLADEKRRELEVLNQDLLAANARSSQRRMRRSRPRCTNGGVHRRPFRSRIVARKNSSACCPMSCAIRSPPSMLQ